MLGALEKYLLMAAEKAKGLQGMSKLDMLALAAKKGAQGVGAGAKAVGKNPLAAGIGAGGGALAAGLMGDDEDDGDEDDIDDLLKAYQR